MVCVQRIGYDLYVMYLALYYLCSLKREMDNIHHISENYMPPLLKCEDRIPLIRHECETYRVVITTKGSYLWSFVTQICCNG
jgi:hypothetical protein